MTQPRISVIVDTYNHERYISQSIESVLTQLEDFHAGEVEVVVVDDGSSDKTPEILAAYEPRVRVMTKANGGQASAFNAVIAGTSGEIVAFLDGDDWWSAGKLRAVVKAFDENPSVAAVGHGFYEVHDDAQPSEMFVPDQTRRLDLSSVDAARVADLGRTLLGTSRLAVRRRVLARLGAIPEALTFCADTPILTLALAIGGAIVLDQPLCYYRMHASSLFALREPDPRKLRARCDIQRFLLGYLPAKLAEVGVGAAVIDALFASDRIELERTVAWLGDRGRRDAAGTELKALRNTRGDAGPRYAAFKAVAATVAFVLPAAQYQRLRDWYARNDLKRVRDKFAPVSTSAAETMFQRRPVTRTD
jgi:glycosyltransferase involved in cell wall biosynthesis